MSWVANIYQKFEAVCKEMDDIVNHDSVKFIEKQVQNVSKNVMKFYSTLAQVIVTPIGDLEFDEDEDRDLEFDEDEKIDGQDATVISHVKSLTTIDEEAAAMISQVKLLMTIEKELAILKEFANKTDMQSSVEDDDVDILQVLDTEESAFGSTFESECYSCESSALYYVSSVSSASSVSMPSLTDVVASSAINFNETIEEIKSNIFQDKDFIISSSFVMALHNEAIDIAKWYSEYISSQIDSNGNCSCNNDTSTESLESSVGSSDTIDLEKETENLSHKVTLEESCVMVDYSTSHNQKQPSYKKKILDALSSDKKKLAKEYKELAILHGHNATKCCQKTSLLLRDSQTIQLNGSEWELL